MNIPIRGHQLATTARFSNKEHNYYLLSTQHHLMTSVNLRLPFLVVNGNCERRKKGRTELQYNLHIYFERIRITITFI